MENMRRIINIQAGKPVLVEPENNTKTLCNNKTSQICIGLFIAYTLYTLCQNIFLETAFHKQHDINK